MVGKGVGRGRGRRGGGELCGMVLLLDLRYRDKFERWRWGPA